VFRVFDTLRIVYPLHVIDDGGTSESGVDNFEGYVSCKAGNAVHGMVHPKLRMRYGEEAIKEEGASGLNVPLVPVGPRVAPFYRRQYLDVESEEGGGGASNVD
jgi:hypothetical protein